MAVIQKPLYVGNLNLDAGQAGVRVKASPGRPASLPLFSDAAYTEIGLFNIERSPIPEAEAPQVSRVARRTQQ